MEHVRDIKSSKPYILVTHREGIVYKRVFNYLQENGKLFLVSDNRQYAPYQIDATEVIEVWSAKAYINVQFRMWLPKNDISMEQLAGMVMELQQEIHSSRSDKGLKKSSKG